MIIDYMGSTLLARTSERFLEVDIHRARWLVACFYAVDVETSGALQEIVALTQLFCTIFMDPVALAVAKSHHVYFLLLFSIFVPEFLVDLKSANGTDLLFSLFAMACLYLGS